MEILDMKKMDDVIETMKEYGHDLDEIIEKTATWKYFDINETLSNLIKRFEGTLSDIKNENEKEILIKNIQTLFELIQKNSDSIWPYILRNMYKPIPLTEKKVDIVIGNPPWIAQQAIKNESYQNYLKQESKKYGLLDTKKIHNIPNLELSSLFFCHCSDQYLKEKGKIAFVMPRSVLDASQHENFRTFDNPKIELKMVYDLFGYD